MAKIWRPMFGKGAGAEIFGFGNGSRGLDLKRKLFGFLPGRNLL